MFIEIIIVNTFLLLSMVPNKSPKSPNSLIHHNNLWDWYHHCTHSTEEQTEHLGQGYMVMQTSRFQSPCYWTTVLSLLKMGIHPQHMQIYLFINYIHNGYHLANYAYFKTSKIAIRKEWNYRTTNISPAIKVTPQALWTLLGKPLPQATNLNRSVLTTFLISNDL